MARIDNRWLEMTIDNLNVRSDWVRHASHPVVNVLAALLMLRAATLPPFPLSYLYPTALAWVPVAAFCLAALAGCRRMGAWVPLVALGANVAALVLCFLTAVAAATDLRIGSSGLVLAVPGAAVATWNLLRLSKSLGHD